MFQPKKNRIIILFILFFILIVLIRGLYIDVSRDSGKYAAIAKELYLNGNWLHLTIGGEAYLQKPPLLFWTSALSFHIFGISNFSFKILLLLFSLLGVYFTYQLGRSLYNKKTGIVSAIILLFSEYFLLYNMDIHTDSLLLPFVTLSLWQLSEFLQYKKTKNLIWTSIGIGLSMLTKGPIGAVVPFLATGSLIIVNRDFKRFIDFRWLIAVFIILAIISPALLSLYQQFGADGIKFYFLTNNVGRLTGKYLGTNTDYSYYTHTLLYMLLPWSLFFFYASFQELRRIHKKQIQKTNYFTIGGIWLFILLMSISRSKLPNYIYIATPLMSILSAKWIVIATRNYRKKIFSIFRISQTLTQIIIWCLIIGISIYLFPIKNVAIIITTSILFLLVIYNTRTNSRYIPFLNSLVTMGALVFILNFHAFPEIYTQQAAPKAAQIYNQLSQKEDKLYNFKYGQYELFFYGKDKVIPIKNDTELKQIIKSGNSWIFTNEEGFSTIESLFSKYPYDSIIPLRHAVLKDGIRYINPKSRERSKKNMYLLKYK